MPARIGPTLLRADRGRAVPKTPGSRASTPRASKPVRLTSRSRAGGRTISGPWFSAPPISAPSGRASSTASRTWPKLPPSSRTRSNPNLLFLGTSAGVYRLVRSRRPLGLIQVQHGARAGHRSAGASARRRPGGRHLWPRRLGHEYRPVARSQPRLFRAKPRCFPSALLPSAMRAAWAITGFWAIDTPPLPTNRTP